ncbi:hypothetical protein MMC11_000153 [Xylographa trunciseda]|nr:hypothetical protein [Xylographa trunciseda]
MLEHDPQVTEYEHEKFRPREAEALQTLRKVASLVKPIMRQRGWVVGTLAEFWPPEKNLLGVNWNKGQKICLRLRYPYDERQFLPIEEVVDTMLHELCHIVHGPHDDPFHKLWNQLRDEHESLLRKGYTGEGFLSSGHKLGGGRIPMHEARRRARAAAEKRQTLNAGSGQKLGGRSVRRGEDIRKVIADAATRRSTVERGCASGTERGQGLVEETTRNGFRTKAEEDDANEDAIMQAYIEMIQEEEREKYGKDYVQPSNSNPAGNLGVPVLTGFKPNPPTPVPTLTKPPIPTNTNPPKVANTIPDIASDGWSCDVCTLYNPSNYLLCDACGTERPASTFSSFNPPTPLPSTRKGPPQSTLPPKNPPSKSIKSLSSLSVTNSKKPLGWVCHRCGNFMESEWWTCAGCGTMKQSS